MLRSTTPSMRLTERTPPIWFVFQAYRDLLLKMPQRLQQPTRFSPRCIRHFRQYLMTNYSNPWRQFLMDSTKRTESRLARLLPTKYSPCEATTDPTPRRFHSCSPIRRRLAPTNRHRLTFQSSRSSLIGLRSHLLRWSTQTSFAL